MYHVVVKMFTFAISSPDEFLYDSVVETIKSFDNFWHKCC